MKNRFPKILCALILLLITLTALPSCSGKKSPDPAGTTDAAEQSDSAVANANELIGSWMLVSGGRMEIYTFRPNGEVMIYEMESATVVRDRQTGSYSLNGSRLIITIGGNQEIYAALTEGGSALILNGEILTPTTEPKN